MKLDVGCGHAFKGDVNIDLFIEATAQRCEDHRKNIDTPLIKIPNLIKAEATHLPIKSDSFDIVLSTHVIEHLDNPQQLLIEMKRVAKLGGLIHIETPHRMGNKRRWVAHKHSFTGQWFERIFKLMEIKIVDSKPAYLYIPHAYMPLFKIPTDLNITGQVFKK